MTRGFEYQIDDMSRQAQPQVHKYSDACHQSFDTEKDATKHVETFDAMWTIREEIEGMMNISI